MKKLTQERLKELLHYYPETGEFYWKVGYRQRKVGDLAGYFSSRGYIQIGIDRGLYLAHRLAWLYVYGYFPEHGLDHINRCKIDNRIYNLREASQSCNMRNSPIRRCNTSGVKGVCWCKRNSKWHSQIGIDRKVYHLGFYSSFDEAVCARLAAEQCLNWSGCDSSSPAFKYVQKILN